MAHGIGGGQGPPENEAARLSRGGEARPKRFNGNSNASVHNLTKLQEQANQRLGARAYFGFVDEFDRHDDIPDLDRRLERYANADPNLVARLGADQFPAGPLRIVGAGL